MKKKNAIILTVVILVIILISVIVEAVINHPQGEVIWELIPGADAVIGFVGAFILIFVSKKIIGPLLQKKEDYYGDDND